MVAEDLNKIKQINTANTTSTVINFNKSKTETNTVENIFKAFQKFAAQRGVTIKTEDFQAIINANPQIFELPLEKQAIAIAKYITENEKSAPAVDAQTTADTEQDIQENQTTFSFSALSQEDKDQLANTINEMLASQTVDSQNTEVSKTSLAALPQTAENKAPQSETVSKEYSNSVNEKQVDNNPIDAALKEELNNTIEEQTKPRLEAQNNNRVQASASTNTQEMQEKDLYNEYLDQYAKNIFIFGPENHSEDDWNKLTSDEKAQFIKDNNIESSAQKLLEEADITFSILSNDKKSKQTKETILRTKILAVQAATTNKLVISEFQNLSKMEQGVAIVDIIAQKDPEHLTPNERLALEEAKILKDAVIYKFKSVQKSADNEKVQLIEKMNFSELYATLKKANKTDSLLIYLKDYLEDKKPRTYTEYEKATYKILKRLPVYAIQGFGTLAGISDLESEIANDEKLNTEYLNAAPEKRAQIKAEYFYKQYGDNPEKFTHAFQDAIKHGNILEAQALISLLDNKDLKLTNIKAALKELRKSDINLLVFGRRTKTLNGAIDYTFRLVNSLTEAYSQNKLSAQETTSEARTLVIDNPEDVPEIAEKLPELNEHVAVGIIQGSGELARVGKIVGQTLHTLGEKVVECNERVQDAGVELTCDKTIDSDLRAEFAKPLFENSGYAAQKGVENHVAATFEDNANAQKLVFTSIKKGIENHCPKPVAVKNLNDLDNQISELREDVQVDAFSTMLNSKYEEVKIHTASIIHTLSESAQAGALKVAYDTGNIEVIEAATLQVDKMAKTAVEKMKNEIKAQITAMEDRHSLSAMEELALRELKKSLGFGTDTTTTEFKTRLEAYIAELKKLPRSEVYLRICNDIQSWPADKQALVLEAVAKYCPLLFSMMLERYGSKLLVSFGQLNSTTKNTILTQMLKTPSKRSEALAYIQANPNGNYSDNLKTLYNEILDMMIANGTITEDHIGVNNLKDSNYQTVPTNFSSQNSIVTIGQKYNWNMASDVDGNIGLIS